MQSAEGFPTGPTHEEDTMEITGKTVLVTGANRGIGQALVEEALRRGAKRIYAGTRGPLVHSDGRVTAIALDVTDAAQIQAAVERIGSLDTSSTTPASLSTMT
jgi:NAD(P)-dependent dehydrogenase (short-subunit alcohol dehydrogenase family)